MNAADFMMNNQDHIMANTWRLIFERRACPVWASSRSRPVVDFTALEEVLFEYRLIGLTLADRNDKSRCH